MSLKGKYLKLKTHIASLVLRTKQNLRGKPGERKMPNAVTDHDGFGDIVADPDASAEAAAPPKGLLLDAQNIAPDTQQEMAGERIHELCVRGVAQEAPSLPGEATKSIPAGGYFKRGEFSCKCGCGTNKVKAELIGTLNVLRETLDMPIVVTSGTRCEKHNAKVGGVPGSNHLSGDAADIQAPDASADTVWRTAKELHERERLPHLAGLGRYRTFTHLDVSPKRTDGCLREWEG